MLIENDNAFLKFLLSYSVLFISIYLILKNNLKIKKSNICFQEIHSAFIDLISQVPIFKLSLLILIFLLSILPSLISVQNIFAYHLFIFVLFSLMLMVNNK
jgi:hypothetical protein